MPDDDPEVRELAEHLARLIARVVRGRGSAPAAPAVPRMVTLDQAAAMVHRTKSALEHYRRHRKRPLPDPTVEGGGGQPALWEWGAIRPWLEETFRVSLPDETRR